MIMLNVCSFFLFFFYFFVVFFCRVINGSNVDIPTPHGPPNNNNKMKSESNLHIDEINFQKKEKKYTHTEMKQNEAINTRN